MVFSVFLSVLLIGGLIQWQINVSAFREHMGLLSAILQDQQISLSAREAHLRNEQKLHQDVLAQNKVILAENKKVLADNQIAIYQIKESSIFLYDHYINISDLLTNNVDLARSDEQIDEMMEEAQHAESGIQEVVNFFYTVFKMSPEQYREMKHSQKIKFKQVMKKPNGENFESDFSLN